MSFSILSSFCGGCSELPWFLILLPDSSTLLSIYILLTINLQVISILTKLKPEVLNSSLVVF